MTDKTKEAPARSALKLALDALKKSRDRIVEQGGSGWKLHAQQCVNTITAIREAMADIGNPITEQLAIPTVITCPFCASEHVPGWLHDYNMDRGAWEQPAIKQDLTPEQNQCKFPLCQSKEYQQALAEQIKRELYTGETSLPQQEPVATVCSFGDLGGTFDWASPRTYRPPVGAKLYASPPAQQEPVAWRWVNPKGWLTYGEQPHDKFASTPLYTSPPAHRSPLTDEQIVKCWGQVSGTRYGYVAFARAIERAHGIKGGK